MIRKYSVILLFIAPLFILAPFEVNYLIEANSLVYSAKEWRLTRDNNGELSSMIIDNDRNFSTSKTDYIFDRGDVAKINFYSHNKRINEDDTIAVINSDVINEQIITLQSQLEVAKAEYQDKVTGQKASIIKEFDDKLRIAKSNVEFTTIQLERAEKMVKEDLIPQLEYDRFKNANNLAKINLQLAQKSLETVSTGEKSEILDVIKSQIKTLQERIANLEQKKDKYIIKAPFRGIINYYQDSIDLIKIKDPSDFIVKIPVKVYEIGYVDLDDKVELSIDKTDNIYNAVITNIEDEIRIRGRDQFFLVTARVTNPDKFIRPGMICRASIYSEKVPLYTYAKRKLGF